jgi:hypothetical protein
MAPATLEPPWSSEIVPARNARLASFAERVKNV